jgi:hypothetical protein
MRRGAARGMGNYPENRPEVTGTSESAGHFWAGIFMRRGTARGMRNDSDLDGRV